MTKKSEQFQNQLTQLKNEMSAMLARQDFAMRAGLTHAGNRDVYDVCGFPQTLKFDDFWAMYKRRGVGSTAIKAYPDASWNTGFSIVENQEKQGETKFEKEFKALDKRLGLARHFRDADIKARIGGYSVIYIGFRDGKDTSLPVESSRGFDSIAFLKVYSSKNAIIKTVDDNISSPRFGKPVMYEISTNITRTGRMTGKKLVHWTRLIHIVENSTDDELLGAGALESVFNDIVSLEKVVCASPEVFWLNARGAFVGKVDKEAENISGDAIKDAMDEVVHKLRRTMLAQGVDFEYLSMPVPDPKNTVDVLMQQISAGLRIPVRILLGSERGELASSQDAHEWDDRVHERQTTHCEPFIINPFMERLFALGVIQRAGDYVVEWPRKNRVSEKDRAEIALKKATALKMYADAKSSNIEELVVPRQFVEEIMDEEYREEDINALQDTLDDEL